MKLFDTLAEMGHEEVVMCSDPSVGYRGILAVHSTKLGPALGGTRFWQYATDDEAITDALPRVSTEERSLTMARRRASHGRKTSRN